MEFRLPRYLFLSLLCFILDMAYGQLYNFKNFGTKDGLAGSNVNSIFQDSHGYIWFATQTGVSRFDGKVFTNFTSNDGLVTNDVTCINEDKNGNIWIGTMNGASEYDGKKFNNYSVNQGLGVIHSIFIDDLNTIWFATDTAGVVVYDRKKFRTITKNNGLLSNMIFAIAKDNQGIYWFATYSGISKYVDGKIINFQQNKEVGGKTFYSILVDSKGDLWFGGFVKNGLVKYKAATFEKISLPNKLADDDNMFSLLEDTKHNIWVTTDHGGILKYDGSNFTLFDESNGLSSNQVYSINCDYEGNIWIGTTNGGADLFTNELFSTYTDKQGLSSNKIAGIHEDNTNTLLVGTQGFGLNILNNDKTITSIGELKNSSSISINQNDQGEIYIGTINDGIYILKKENNNFFIKSHIAKTGKNKIVVPLKIVFDKKGNTWVADYGSGLFCINKNNEIKNYNTSNGFVSDNIVTLFEDSNDDLWIGTSDAGAIKYNGITFISYSEKDGFADKFVWSITENDKHIVFFGTQEKGICYYDPSAVNNTASKKFKTISTTDGLCSNFIEVLQWDNIDKCLWTGTEKGINKIKFTPELGIQSIHYYGEREGFKGGEVSTIEIPQNNPDIIWFGTNNGLCCYNRKFDYQNTAAPKLLLTDILLAYKEVDWKKYSDSIDPKNNLPKNLVLSHKDNHLTIHFKALTTDKVMYSYILEGQDAEWSPLSVSNEANFSNIASGKTYTFKVKAVNSNGVWNTTPVSFTFTIKLPWWETWWFYTISIIVILIFIYLFINYRTSKIAKEKELLETIVGERTKELSESNKNIKDSITYAQRIQNGILPSEKLIKKHLPDSFVLYKPKDIVAGDFYWLESVDDLVLFAACDCTGHGVPGAMVSVICNNALHRAVNELGLRAPDKILTKTAEFVIENFTKSEEEINDGMDVSFCCYNSKTKVLTWAGANNPLWLIKNGKLIEIKPNKLPIARNDIGHSFNSHEFTLETGDKIYIFSDGYSDQFGVPTLPDGSEDKTVGDDGKKLTKKRFRELILSIHHLSMDDQKTALDTYITDYRRDIEQTDDILVMGVLI
jgi:ligand-binding sensor domain-containing protein/serine phosphatase RsbU (regulator of sigma subunit)